MHVTVTANARRQAMWTCFAVALVGHLLMAVSLANPLNLRYDGTYALLSLAMLVASLTVALALLLTWRVRRAIIVGLTGASLVVTGGLVVGIGKPRDSLVTHVVPVTSGVYRLEVVNTTYFPHRGDYHRTVRLSRVRGPLSQVADVYASRTVSPEGQPTVETSFTGRHRIRVTTGACRFEYTFHPVTLQIEASPDNAFVTATC